jgi:hypothetical protein
LKLASSKDESFRAFYSKTTKFIKVKIAKNLRKVRRPPECKKREAVCKPGWLSLLRGI